MLRQRAPRTKDPRKAISSSARKESPFSSPPRTSPKSGITTNMDVSEDARQPLLRAAKLSKLAKNSDTESLSERRSSPPSYTSTSPDVQEGTEMELQNMSRKSQWIMLAVASGACAAFNGVFAKLYVYVIPSHSMLPPDFGFGRSRQRALSRFPKVLTPRASPRIDISGHSRLVKRRAADFKRRLIITFRLSVASGSIPVV